MNIHPLLIGAALLCAAPLPAQQADDPWAPPAASAPAPAEPAAPAARAGDGFWSGREARATDWAERLWAAPESAAIDFDENTLQMRDVGGADAGAIEMLREALEDAFDEEFEDDVELTQRDSADWRLDLVVVEQSPTRLVYDLILRDRGDSPRVAARVVAEAKKPSALPGRVEEGCVEFVALLKKGRALKAYQGK